MSHLIWRTVASNSSFKSLFTSHKCIQRLNLVIMTDPAVFNSINLILDVLKGNMDNPGVAQLLDIYDNVVANQVVVKKKYPLIVIEGLDGSGKSTIAKILAEKIVGVAYQTPPPSVSEIRDYFDENQAFRSAYYHLGNYIAAIEMQKILESKPVILDRYWHSTVAYAIASSVVKNPVGFLLPTKDDKIYQWPVDLLKPDAVFLLDVAEEERVRRLSLRKFITDQEKELRNSRDFRNCILTAYMNFKHPSITLINGNPTKNVVVDRIYKKIKHLLIID